MTLQKSARAHELPGKNYSIKRKIEEFKEEFITWRENNTSNVKFNKCYNMNNLKEEKVALEEVDSSAKV